MSAPLLCVLISGTRQVGKDSLVSALIKLEPSFMRFAFADPLRADLAPFVLQHYGINIWAMTAEEKELIRPLLIAHGCAKRTVNIDHWVAKTVEQITETHRKWPRDHQLPIPILADGRFCNEVSYLRKIYGSSLKHVNLTRLGAPPPTDEEEKHYREVAAMADVHLRWGGEDEAGRLASAQWLYTKLTES